MTIEVYADVACPFAHVGLRRFVERRRELGRTDVLIRVRAWPLELVNDAPHDPRAMAEEVEQIREQVASDLFVDFDEASFPRSTIPAMTLASAAYDKDLATGEAVSLQLRDLLFERGVDVGDPSVLAGVAEEHGLDAELSDDTSVRVDHQAGLARGVIGSPHFFTPNGDYFCPALDVGHDAGGHLRVRPDPVALGRFIDACFD